MVSVPPEEPLGRRPTAALRCCLSSGFWLPVATVSYSMYLYHHDIHGPMRGAVVFDDTPDGGECRWSAGKAVGMRILMVFCVFLTTAAIGVCSYICIEKPSIDARAVFKHSVEIERLQEKRLEWLKKHGPEGVREVDGEANNNEV